MSGAPCTVSRVSLTRYKPPIGRSCAICTAFVALDRGRMEPLGKGRADVFVCLPCCEDAAVTKFGPELAYEPSGMLNQREISTALEREQGSARYQRDNRLAVRAGLVPAAPTSDAARGARDESATRSTRRRRSGR